MTELELLQRQLDDARTLIQNFSTELEEKDRTISELLSGEDQIQSDQEAIITSLTEKNQILQNQLQTLQNKYELNNHPLGANLVSNNYLMTFGKFIEYVIEYQKETMSADIQKMLVTDMPPQLLKSVELMYSDYKKEKEI